MPGKTRWKKEKEMPMQDFLCIPVLMAADVWMYQSDFVPVGKDPETTCWKLPETSRLHSIISTVKHSSCHKIKLRKKWETVLGTDGQKKEQSSSNTISIFASKKRLKQVMGIKTASIDLKEPMPVKRRHNFEPIYKQFPHSLRTF